MELNGFNRIKYTTHGNYVKVFSYKRKKVIKSEYISDFFYKSKYNPVLMHKIFGKEFLRKNFSYGGERALAKVTPTLLGAEKNDLFNAICCILAADKIYEK